ncbi:MAG: signal recognition particle protein [Pseudomonadota bacterium]|nr:signal recognition particle protein [Pseudomonadota bacterium]
MFDTLSERFTDIFKKLRGYGRLTEQNINDGLRDVRIALLEADVALPIVKSFIEDIRVRSLDKEILTSLTPGQVLIKIVNEELVTLLGKDSESLKLNTQPPAVILLAGLQGAGKTTTCAKLGVFLKEKEKKNVALISSDVYRPGAIKQLEILAKENNLFWLESRESDRPTEIVKTGLEIARRKFFDVLIVDSAGRLHVDNEMMEEIKSLHNILNPIETLFVIDSMMGQDAVNAAAEFNKILPLTGNILTKVDGDSRGGAALTVKYVTGKPIKFIGVGERTEDLTLFNPDRIASQILGMGDVLTLIEEVEKKTDKEKASKLSRKIKKGKGFSLVDFRDQLKQMSNMGGIGNILDKLPGTNKLSTNLATQIDDREFIRLIAIIDSMTRKERSDPKIVNGSRKKRIAFGSGTKIQDINKLLKQFNHMQKMMKKFSNKGGLSKVLKGIPGGKPPGFPF